jgi:hypothetical protein
VRLTQCPRCKRFADKYVEHDNVVLFIDLVLIKPQVRTSQYEVMVCESVCIDEGGRFIGIYCLIGWEGMTRLLM